MVTKKIDGSARLLGKAVGRRAALWSLVALGLAGAAGGRGAGVVSAGAGCTKLRRRCRHHRQCCGLECRQRRCRR